MVRRAMLTSGILVLVAMGVHRPHAAERAEAFVEALRQQSWHDTTLEYLDYITQAQETATLVSDDFRRAIPYEKGRTLTAIALKSGQAMRDTLRQQAV